MADLAPLAHLLAIKAHCPVMHFFDGFRTSHEIQKIEIQDYKEYAKLLDKKLCGLFRENALNPHTIPLQEEPMKMMTFASKVKLLTSIMIMC